MLKNVCDTGLIFAVHTVNQTGPANGSDELAVLGQSLVHVGCSLSLNSLSDGGIYFC